MSNVVDIARGEVVSHADWLVYARIPRELPEWPDTPDQEPVLAQASSQIELAEAWFVYEERVTDYAKSHIDEAVRAVNVLYGDPDRAVRIVKGWVDALQPPQDLPARSLKTPIPAGLRWAVLERDDFRCQHCGSRRYLCADHVRPESKGGPTSLENLQTLCRTCNGKKGSR